MKTTKRVLSIALALLLGLAVLAPMASAADDPNAPVITKQPCNPYNRSATLFLQAGNAFHLEVEAALPEGSQGTLSYAWYDYNWQPGDTSPPVATGASVDIHTTEDTVIAGGVRLSFATIIDYCVVATNTWLDDEQVQQSASRRSDIVQVRLFLDYGAAISRHWEDATKDGISAFLKNMPLTMLYIGGDLFGILGCKFVVFMYHLYEKYVAA